MIITRTPFRISFFGGGTDYPTWYEEHEGTVLSTTFNHYCYLSCRFLAPFFEHKSLVAWSEIERVKNNAQIKHPAVNAILNYLNLKHGVEIHHQGDLPARSGLGSSSAFTVGLLNALYALLGINSNKRQLACEAVHVERDLLKEHVGVQDQIATAYGGFNKIHIFPTGDFSVTPLILPSFRTEELESHLLLFFTGVSRSASEIAKQKIINIKTKKAILTEMQSMVSEAIDILTQGKDINLFGELLDESWQLKQSLATEIAPDFIQTIYQQAIRAGATGGKLLGAGGGGFMLFFVKPEKRQAVLTALETLLAIPFKFENQGSQIIFCEQNQQASPFSLNNRDYFHLNDNEDLATHQKNRINSLRTTLKETT